ncbi:hypothetical protein DRI96_03090 [Candidatus Aerophobetes bacterium]|uniref:Mutator family transposase n=1 Tax=Aerophobetes bacterium TaxID=2030807 RepID=A0A662DFW5_UNCAE|nr:MAG: hypothetical protein DRI96_03090 [Candidatus Aerophobetes bacterium]
MSSHYTCSALHGAQIKKYLQSLSQSYSGKLEADAKRIIYATSKKEALEEFKAWKERYKNLAPKAVLCLEKDLDDVLRFMDFRYKIWASVRTTNIIERVFREFRRRINTMDTFPTEESCIRIMFSLAQLVNESWEGKPFRHFK